MNHTSLTGILLNIETIYNRQIRLITPPKFTKLFFPKQYYLSPEDKCKCMLCICGYFHPGRTLVSEQMFFLL